MGPARHGAGARRGSPRRDTARLTSGNGGTAHPGGAHGPLTGQPAGRAARACVRARMRAAYSGGVFGRLAAEMTLRSARRSGLVRPSAHRRLRRIFGRIFGSPRQQRQGGVPAAQIPMSQAALQAGMADSSVGRLLRRRGGDDVVDRSPAVSGQHAPLPRARRNRPGQEVVALVHMKLPPV